MIKHWSDAWMIYAKFDFFPLFLRFLFRKVIVLLMMFLCLCFIIVLMIIFTIIVIFMFIIFIKATGVIVCVIVSLLCSMCVNYRCYLFPSHCSPLS